MTNKLKKSFGFTLIEILVVATIIGLLAAGGFVTYSNLSRQSRDAKRKADLEQIRSALEMYRSNNSSYTAASLDGNCSGLNWLGDYIGTIPTDPKTDYNYYCDITANDYTLYTALENDSDNCGETCRSTAPTNCTYKVGPYGEESCP